MDSIPRMPATLAELEVRVAALEAERGDYRAVLTAINALGENQRELAVNQRKLEENVRELAVNQRIQAVRLDDTNSRVRSIEENLAEVKDLLLVRSAEAARLGVARLPTRESRDAR